MLKIEPSPDMEKFEITFTAASAAPYGRMDWETGENYMERLVMTEEACNLNRLNGGASILKNHDPDHVLGKVVKAWIQNGILCVRAAFRKNDPESASIFKDAVDGTLQNVSVGYTQDSFKTVTEDGITYRDITGWTIFEVSVAVGVPADASVGFYRKINSTKGDLMNKKLTRENAGETPDEQKKNPPTEENKANTPSGNPDKGTETDAQEQPDDNEEENRESGCGENDDAEERAFHRIVTRCAKELQRMGTATGSAVRPRAPRECRKYNLAEAFRGMLDPRYGGFEREISQELYRKSGLSSSEHSIMIPFTRDTFPTSGTYFDSSNGSGSGLVASENRPDLFVEYIRNRIGVKNAQFITGLTTTTTFPAQTGAGTVGWIDGLNKDTSATAPVVGNITLTPHKLGAFVDVGKDLILQGNPDASRIALNDLMAQISQTLALTMLKGNAANPAITGVATATGVQTVTIANTASATWADMLKFASAVEGKAISGKLEFIMSASDKAALKGVSKDAGSGRFLCEENQIDGYDVTVDGNLTSGEIFFGDFSNILVGQWGGLEVIIDPFKYARSGGVEIIASMIADVAIRNPACFVKAVKPVATT